MKKTMNLNRVDGFAKVTGKATYAAEYKIKDTVYACLVGSTIAKGTIETLDTRAAERAPGVLAVISHKNLQAPSGYSKQKSPVNLGQPLQIFKDNIVRYYDQPIAVVVADSFERMKYAATLVTAKYRKEVHQTSLRDAMADGRMPAGQRGKDYLRGDAEAHTKADVIINVEYVQPTEVHNPMELANIIALWTGDKPTLYTKSQGVEGTRASVGDVFGIPPEDVSVHSEFLGGAFGMGLHTWPYEIAALIASKAVCKPVKLVLHREQMFTNVGFRPYTIQNISMGASKDGTITGLVHEATAQTSVYEDFTEATVNMSRFMYKSPNLATRYRLSSLNTCTPIWMRGPGEATGSFALESAMDEMAFKLGIDPLEFRLRNYAEFDQERNKPWSSNHLKECYEMGMDKIGWKNRSLIPGTLKEGDWQVGYGMGLGTFGSSRNPSSVKASFHADGTLSLHCSVNDMGPGTATMMTAIGADTTGIGAEYVKIEMGTSGLPKGPTQGGSATTSSVGSAVVEACEKLIANTLELALKNIRFAGLKSEDLVYKEGIISAKTKNVSIAVTELLSASQLTEFSATVNSKNTEEAAKYSIYSFSVHFVKVLVNPKLGKVRLAHIVSCADIGTVINHKTSAGQMFGGAVGGIGMGLMEALEMDHRFGRAINNNFADYHVPVNADIEKQEVLFVNKKDPYSNPMGTKGLGETALVGMAPALANAIFNATGKRIRELPITLDKIIS